MNSFSSYLINSSQDSSSNSSSDSDFTDFAENSLTKSWWSPSEISHGFAEIAPGDSWIFLKFFFASFVEIALTGSSKNVSGIPFSQISPPIQLESLQWTHLEILPGISSEKLQGFVQKIMQEFLRKVLQEFLQFF